MNSTMTLLDTPPVTLTLGGHIDGIARSFASRTHATITVTAADGAAIRFDVTLETAQGFRIGQYLTVEVR